MTENTAPQAAEQVKPTEDPEEVAAREAGEQSPAKQEDSTEAAEEVDPAVHVPHTVSARKR